MIDEKGYRLNVGIVVINEKKKVLFAQRSNSADAWQFPQGGIKSNETPLQAMYRELQEELGLTHDTVELLYESPDWHYYDLPKKFQRPYQKPLCIGQKQRWYLLQFVGSDKDVDLNFADHAEFSAWRWVDYWHPLDHVIAFKKDVYQTVLECFDRFIQEQG